MDSIDGRQFSFKTAQQPLNVGLDIRATTSSLDVFNLQEGRLSLFEAIICVLSLWRFVYFYRFRKNKRASILDWDLSCTGDQTFIIFLYHEDVSVVFSCYCCC